LDGWEKLSQGRVDQSQLLACFQEINDMGSAQVFEIIPFLLRKLGADDDNNKPSLASVLQAQVVSEFTLHDMFPVILSLTGIEWTPQVDFGMVPTPWLDGSLLVLGTRAGFVTLLRCVLLEVLPQTLYGSPPDIAMIAL
jgi:hypothetical protein